jgi:hypothetical protein
MSRPSLILVGILVLSAGVGRAGADDELSLFVQRARIAAQKQVADANHALAQSRVLEKADPEQARDLVHKVLAQVKDSQVLDAGERTRLTQQLEARLRQLGEAVRLRRAAQEEAVQRLDPTRPRPNPPAGAPTDIAKHLIEGGNAQVGAARKQKQDRAAGFSEVVNSVQTSAIPVAADVNFSKNWKQLSDLRRKTVGARLTEKEVALLKTLNSTLSPDFKDMSFKDVLNLLQERTGLTIIVDEGSLREAMVDYEDKVDFQAPKVTVRTILRKILADRGLGYILKEGTVQVMTAQKARETMVIRTYPINDIVAPGPYAQMFGPYISQLQMLGNAQGVINLVQNSVDPAMWAVNGGPATISFMPQTMSLVVRASAEMHYSLNGQLFGP